MKIVWPYMFGYAFIYTNSRLKRNPNGPSLGELIWSPLIIDSNKNNNPKTKKKIIKIQKLAS